MKTLLFAAILAALCSLAACAVGPAYNGYYYGYDRDYYYGYPYNGYWGGYYAYGPHGYGPHGSPYVYRYYERREKGKGVGHYEEHQKHERMEHRSRSEPGEHHGRGEGHG